MDGRPSTTRVLSAAVCALVLGLLVAAPAALAGREPAAVAEPRALDLAGTADAGARASYRRLPFRWRGGRIPYYNAAKGNAWAVKRAVRAWNSSGARVRFVAVRRSRARVVIRYFSARGCVPAGRTPVSWNGRTGRAIRAEVLLSRPDPRLSACSRWSIAITAAHELGHVLGLDHETRRCALMNPTSLNISPSLCNPRPLPDWRWRCRLLESDDVRGAVRTYGGRVRRRPRSVCDLLPAPAAPGAVAAAPDAFGRLVVRVRRPAPRARPAHLAYLGAGSYLIGLRRDSCPSLSEALVGRPWSVPAGAAEEIALPRPGAGRYCVSAWSRDGTGRISRATAAFVDL